MSLALGLVFGLACKAERPTESGARRPWPEGMLVAAALSTDDRAIVADAGGIIHWTHDAGQTFQRAQVPAVSTLAAIEMVDDRVGWAVGPGVVLHTEDGGERWTRQRIPGSAAAYSLVAVAAVDGLRACALDDRGRLIETRDAGAVWRVRRELGAFEEAGAFNSQAGVGLSCEAGAGSVCFAVGSGWGSVVQRFVLGGETLAPLHLSPPVEGRGVAFRTGGSDPDAASLAGWLRAADRLRSEPVDWKIDVRVSAAELEVASIERDPGWLFDLIEDRGEELVRRLEEAGVPSDRIFLEGAPPWGYEDHLDDDPRFLERYWSGRLASEPIAEIQTRWNVALNAVALAREGPEILVGGAGGRLFVGDRQGERGLRMERLPDERRPLALARLAKAWVATGRQGALWEAEVGPASLGTPAHRGERAGSGTLVWRSSTLHGSAPFFDALRDVAVSPSGRAALVVGDAGRMLWREGDRTGWRGLGLPTQGGRSGLR